MAELIDSYELSLSTDFALLGAVQDRVINFDVDTQTFAASDAGAIGMIAGNKYAELHVRLERWNTRPPPARDEWEDRDELPWQAVPDAGLLVVRGFDGEHPGGLDVTGLGRARAIILATGRHRYRYSDDIPSSEEPERWLIRLFPDPDGIDAMAGPRRRIAGALPFDVARDSWQLALHGWSTGGWTHSGIGAFGAIHRALVIAGGPVTPDQLLERLRTDGGFVAGWQTQCFGPPERPSGYPFEMPPDEVTPALESAAAMTLNTLSDALECLLRLGLLARSDRERHLVPTPFTPPIWDLLELPAARRTGIRIQGLQRGFAPLVGDIKHLLRWTPQGVLTATLTQIGDRLALTTHQVRGAVRLLVARGEMSTDVDVADLDDHTPLNGRLTRGTPIGID